MALTAAAEGLAESDRGARRSRGRDSWLRRMATVEELYLLAQIARGLSCANIDHRLRQLDFRAQENEAAFPNLGVTIADVERLDGVLVDRLESAA